MKEKFLQRFWNESMQSRVRRQIYTGKYDPGQNKSMSKYVMELFRASKTLDSPKTDREFISNISQHYDYDTARLIRPGIIPTLNEVIEFSVHTETVNRSRKADYKMGGNVNKQGAKSNLNSYNTKDNWRGRGQSASKDNTHRDSYRRDKSQNKKK